MEKLIRTITIIIAALVWYSNAEILLCVKKCSLPTGQALEIWQIALQILFGLGYSILTAYCIANVRKFVILFFMVCFDAFAIFLNAYVDITDSFLIIASLYLAIYGAYTLSVCWYIINSNRKQEVGEKSEKSRKQSENLEVSKKPNKSLILSNNLEETKKIVKELPPEGYRFTTLKALTGSLNANKTRPKADIIAEASPEVQAEYYRRYPPDNTLPL